MSLLYVQLWMTRLYRLLSRRLVRVRSSVGKSVKLPTSNIWILRLVPIEGKMNWDFLMPIENYRRRLSSIL